MTVSVTAIKGVRARTPNYSMASSIDIRLPRREDHTWLNDWDVDPACVARVDNSRAHAKIGEILARAFPQHDDRSDSQTDYFDFKFSIS